MAPRRYDRRSRNAAAEETRRRIVRATAELHAEHGGLGTTHRMIAERAGVSVPTVYKYFPTRNDLIPHCTGLVFSEAPVRLDGSALEGKTEVPERLRAVVRRAYELYDYAEPWLRWSARDAPELPALQAVLAQAAEGRAALVRAALAPGFSGRPPRRLVALASILIDYPAWRALLAAGYTTAGAIDATAEALITLFSQARSKDAS